MLKKKSTAEFTSKKRKISFILFSIFLVISLIFYFFSENAIKFYNKNFVNNHQEIVIYLDKIDLYNDYCNNIVDNICSKLSRTPPDQYSIEIEDAKNDIRKLIEQTNTLTPPQGFKKHKALFKEVLTRQIIVLSNYKKISKVYPFSDQSSGMSEVTQMRDLERKELLKDLKKAGIPYKELRSGSIRYWYKSHFSKII
jgi:hypothetical protein